jgi:hypothetical protein
MAFSIEMSNLKIYLYKKMLSSLQIMVLVEEFIQSNLSQNIFPLGGIEDQNAY